MKNKEERYSRINKEERYSRDWHVDYSSPTLTRKNAIVEYIDYLVPATQLKGPKGDADMQAVKRDELRHLHFNLALLLAFIHFPLVPLAE